MKFGVFTDLHYDVVHDADRRMNELISHFKEEQVDFVVELGDLCNPIKENTKILDAFKCAKIPCYCSIGNHNTDFCSPETVLDFFGLKKGYYSVIQENIKFIFLDANYIKTESGYVPECKANVKEETDQCPYVPPQQIEWLKDELSSDEYDYVICSHQSLANDYRVGVHSRGIVNRREIQRILEDRNAAGKRILFCMNGNDHGDRVAVINDIVYYSLNSASYIWHGVKETYNYPKAVHEKYTHLKHMILYEQPLHIIVTIDGERNVTIEGMDGRYQNVSPQDVGIGDSWNGVSIKPKTSSLYIRR